MPIITRKACENCSRPLPAGRELDSCRECRQKKADALFKVGHGITRADYLRVAVKELPGLKGGFIWPNALKARAEKLKQNAKKRKT